MSHSNDPEEAFEALWPKDEACKCAGSDEGRTIIIKTTMETAVDVHRILREKGICPIMLPTTMGMLTALVLAIQQKIENPTVEIPMLQFPEVGNQSRVAFAAAENLITSANEIHGKS